MDYRRNNVHYYHNNVDYYRNNVDYYHNNVDYYRNNVDYHHNNIDYCRNNPHYQNKNTLRNRKIILNFYNYATPNGCVKIKLIKFITCKLIVDIFN